MHLHDGSRVDFSHMFAVSFAGFVAVANTLSHRRAASKQVEKDQKIIPKLERTESGRLGKLEKFSHYVARQIGFEDPEEVPGLCKLANDFLRKAKDWEENMYEYFDKEEDAALLYGKLIHEFDRCILTYFSFHWNQAPAVISQALSSDSGKKTQLKEMLSAVMRKQKFEKITKELKVTRLFSTLVEEMKVINGDSKCTDVMAPMALSERSPVLLLMGGGMGAGKSTVLKDIRKEPFWEKASEHAVVVEADAFKESDVIYKALNSMGHHHDMLQISELVHQSSTDAASSLLVTALNEGRDVIMDGTLSWEPFVEQTIDMARNVHKHRYRMGVGYKVAEDGTVTEKYWERVDDEEEDANNDNNRNRKPYRIELCGVVCDGYLAVVRGIRRAIITGRAVRVNSQLKSHKRFVKAFEKYCQLVDHARLYCTNIMGSPPKLIGWKEGQQNLLVDPKEIKCLESIGNLNADADSIYELYKPPSPALAEGSMWDNIVLSPSRETDQQVLKDSIQKIENLPTNS
ncbi:hypothetical protein QN277_007596 [Acacia crassicarpa]|uniref:Zeta toxin domain-containing protein n=1 Tax=Acacia crassicarpa TaxID=499986 RepID=A0AAE1MA54_9FABA|nr:hypothetical protein QN277_007596 [Acacia crassicarpa]